MLRLVHWLLVQVICKRYRLDNGVDHALCGYLFVRLHAGETKRSQPLDWVTGGGDNLRTLREPFLDVVGVVE